MELPITGGCYCGAVRYTINKQPFGQANCHCRACQHTTGGAFAPVLLVPSEALNLTGILRNFVSEGDSGYKVTRAFCGECGTIVVAHTTRVETMRPVYAITLDHPEQFTPELNAWTDFAQPWVYHDPGLPQYPRDLPAELAGLPVPGHRRPKG
jgi:hypothetical protein